MESKNINGGPIFEKFRGYLCSTNAIQRKQKIEMQKESNLYRKKPHEIFKCVTWL